MSKPGDDNDFVDYEEDVEVPASDNKVAEDKDASKK